MALPVVYRRRVGRDLAEARAWYEERRAGLGEELLASIGVSFDVIESFPEIFAAVRGEVRRAVVSEFPYVVFYRIELRQVVVLAVVHTAQDPKSWPRPRNRSR